MASLLFGSTSGVTSMDGGLVVVNRLVTVSLICIMLIISAGCSGKSATLPFKIGDPYGTVKMYVDENGEYYHDNLWLFERYFDQCSGWFDYLGTGDKQCVIVSAASVDDPVVKIELDVLASNRDYAVKTLADIYGVDADSITPDEDDTVYADDLKTKITIEDREPFPGKSAFYAGEECFRITIEATSKFFYDYDKEHSGE